MGRKTVSSLDRIKNKLLRRYKAIDALYIIIQDSKTSIFLKGVEESITIHEADIRLRYTLCNILSDKRFKIRLGFYTGKNKYENLNSIERKVLHLSNKTYRKLLGKKDCNFGNKFYSN